MTDHSIPRTTPERWRGLARTTGVTAIVAVVLLFGPIIAISAVGEPPFDATNEEAAEFFRNTDTPWIAAAQATASIGMLAFLWFVVGFTTLLRRVEGEPAWRSTVALVSGTLVAAYGVIDASWDAAGNRGQDLDPAVAAFAFDLGNLGFANAWLALGSFAIASGWVLLVSRALPAWWGWWAIVGGVGLIAVRYAWEGWVWTIPYFIFWIWVIAIAIRLIGRRALEASTIEAEHTT
ncbi:hypothetical protein [Agromyces albus]|uniref:DUF4386 family protein n=1 Tax=Agromyces albus TaxID=205332 RepID=A0A4Q2KYA3_9MICO|nr:hypothetical protein [Agromyces albus]RXZ69987.1 hypothetical protein ESP51_11205 [Agromyces albus]